MDAKVSLYSENNDILKNLKANRELFGNGVYSSEVEIVDAMEGNFVAGEE